MEPRRAGGQQLRTSILPCLHDKCNPVSYHPAHTTQHKNNTTRIQRRRRTEKKRRHTLTPIPTTPSRSCTTNRSPPKASASNIVVDPIPPPTSTTVLPGASAAQSKPAVRAVQVSGSLSAEGGRGEKGDRPFRRPPGGSHAQLPVIAFPNLSNLNRFPLPATPTPTPALPRLAPFNHSPSLTSLPSPSPSPSPLNPPAASNHPKYPTRAPNAKLNGASVGAAEYFVDASRWYASVR